VLLCVENIGSSLQEDLWEEASLESVSSSSGTLGNWYLYHTLFVMYIAYLHTN
jgi:hypothetical protein